MGNRPFIRLVQASTTASPSARVIITGVRRVYPEPAREMSVDELYAEPPRHRVGDRPWVGVCMIASLDGSTVVAGKSAGLSNPDDIAVLATLRRAADAIIVGASTVRRRATARRRRPASASGS